MTYDLLRFRKIESPVSSAFQVVNYDIYALLFKYNKYVTII